MLHLSDFFCLLRFLLIFRHVFLLCFFLQILWMINITWLKWVLVLVGAALSGGVLVLTFWPTVKEDTVKVATIFVGVVFILHLALAAGFVVRVI